MGYNETNWKTGDIVTAEKLNNIENGISSTEPMIVNVTNFVLNENGSNPPFVMLYTVDTDKTFEEIYDAIIANKTVTARVYDEDGSFFTVPFSYYSTSESDNVNEYDITFMFLNPSLATLWVHSVLLTKEVPQSGENSYYASVREVKIPLNSGDNSDPTVSY